jgi:hypothetical protein
MDSHALVAEEQVGAVGRQVHAGLQQCLCPLLALLDAQVDRRLVRTLLASVAAILALRHRAHGLLLSELGPIWPVRPMLRPGPNGSPICSAPPAGARR